MYLKNISLIGFMGSGKSTTGKIIAEKLNYLFIDIDKMIESVYALSINEIFKKYGESHFRIIENNIINKAYYNKSCVFACGGGAFNKEENIKIIRQNSYVVYLAITEEEAYERLKDKTDRPLLETKGDLMQKIRDIMEQRLSIYINNCDIKIDTDRKSPVEISSEVIACLGMHQ